MAHRVAVNLIVGAKGETTWGGTSAGLSFAADRARFHQLRREFQAILIGGNTAHHEPYAKTPLPLIVLTHRPLPDQVAKNPVAQAWELPPSRKAIQGKIAQLPEMILTVALVPHSGEFRIACVKNRFAKHSATGDNYLTLWADAGRMTIYSDIREMRVGQTAREMQ